MDKSSKNGDIVEVVPSRNHNELVMKESSPVSAINNCLKEWLVNPNTDLGRLLTRSMMSQGALVTDVIQQLMEAVAEDIVLSVRTMSKKEIEICQFDSGDSKTCNFRKSCEDTSFKLNLKELLMASLSIISPHPMVCAMIDTIAISCENAKKEETLSLFIALKRFNKLNTTSIEYYKVDYLLKEREKRRTYLGTVDSYSYKLTFELQITKVCKGDEDKCIMYRTEYEQMIVRDCVMKLLSSVKLEYKDVILDPKEEDEKQIEHAITVVSFYKLFTIFKEQTQNLNLRFLPEERVPIKELEKNLNLTNISADLLKLEEELNGLRIKLGLRTSQGLYYDMVVTEIFDKLFRSLDFEFTDVIPDSRTKETKLDRAVTVLGWYKVFSLLKDEVKKLNSADLLEDEKIDIDEVEKKLNPSSIDTIVSELCTSLNVARIKVALRKRKGNDTYQMIIVKEISEYREKKYQLFFLGENGIRVRDWRGFFVVHWALLACIMYLNWKFAVGALFCVWSFLFMFKYVVLGKQVYQANDLDSLLY